MDVESIVPIRMALLGPAAAALPAALRCRGDHQAYPNPRLGAREAATSRVSEHAVVLVLLEGRQPRDDQRISRTGRILILAGTTNEQVPGLSAKRPAHDKSSLLPGYPPACAALQTLPSDKLAPEFPKIEGVRRTVHNILSAMLYEGAL